MTEDYVSFETAKLLKEKGFDELCSCLYNKKTKKRTNPCEYVFNGEWSAYVTCPTLQMAMKWLREVHNYVISICLDSYVEPYDNEYYIVIRRRKDRFEEISPCEQVYFKTYEQACEAAIKYCLENLI